MVPHFNVDCSLCLILTDLLQFDQVPRDVRDRLPAEFHRALQLEDRLTLGRLQAVVQELIIMFKVNLEMEFAALNYVPLMVRFIFELTLPGACAWKTWPWTFKC